MSPDEFASHFYLQRRVAPSWLENLEDGGVVLHLQAQAQAQARRGSRAERCLSVYLRKAFRLPDLVPDEVSALERALLRLDGTALQHLVLLMGAYVNRDLLKQCVTRDAVSAMHRCLGADGYRYCLLRAPREEQRYWARTDDPADPLDCHDYLVATGLVCLFKLDGLLQPAVAKRLRLLLPRHWVQEIRQAYQVRVHGDMEALFHKLCQEVLENE